MKGIILAGGRGSRLYPITHGISKQLLPIYDKPMIYYPLATLMQAGISEILIITTPEDLFRFESLLRDGRQWGIHLEYAIQPRPEGIAQALVIGESFINKESVALILGDNLFYGHGLGSILSNAKKRADDGAVIFGYEVKDPERYGVVALNQFGELTDIVEKPQLSPSRYAVTGLYFYDSNVVAIAKNLAPSERGEYEITDVNRAYLEKGSLNFLLLNRGFAWLDAGTTDSLHKASAYIQAIQERQGMMVACLEEIAYQMGFISEQAFEALARATPVSEYGDYLKNFMKRQERAAVDLLCN